VLCRGCRRRAPRGEPACPTCGAALRAPADAPLELVLEDGGRVSVGEALTLGRAPDSGLVLPDRTVSRRHARIVRRDGAAWLEDVASSHGTLLDGEAIAEPAPLHDGARIRLGDVEVLVRRPPDERAAGRTLVVQPAVGAGAGDAGPRVRPGVALKRLEAAEGELRYVLRDLRTDRYLRMGSDEAALLELLDGRRSAGALLGEARRRLGADEGPAALATLLASLAEHGLLEGAAPAAPAAGGMRVRLARLARPREREFRRAGRALERLYERGAWLAATREAVVLAAVLAACGLAAFALAAARGGTPLVVASSAGIGGLVFLAGRVLGVALHELAHGLALVSLGRPVRRAGVKAVLLVPFAFVDTSAVWFEPRRRRAAVAAAGPASDLTFGGALALGALAGGLAGEVCFQLALAAYVGAALNLNPLLDRDGYHILSDALGQPALRARSRARLARALAGRPAAGAEPRGLLAYTVASLAWVLALPASVLLLWRGRLDELAVRIPAGAVWGGAALVGLVLLLPATVILGPPLRERLRRPREAGVRRGLAENRVYDVRRARTELLEDAGSADSSAIGATEDNEGRSVRKPHDVVGLLGQAP